MAGPVAGVIVALPLLIYGIAHSRFEIVQYWREGYVHFGHSFLTWAISHLIVGAPPTGYVLDWLSHPFAFAGWIGLLVTMLNLIPVGQLDGGHVVYALVGRRQRRFAFFFFGVLLALSWTKWPGWSLWVIVMLLLMRIAHPPAVIDSVPLDRKRTIIGWAAMVFFILIFMPAPVMGVF